MKKSFGFASVYFFPVIYIANVWLPEGSASNIETIGEIIVKKYTARREGLFNSGLINNGKKKMVALTDLMHKLLSSETRE